MPTATKDHTPIAGRRSQKRDNSPFRLSGEFLDQFKDKKPVLGFGGLGEFVFYRTYSRLRDDGTKESFLDTLQRVVEGCYEIQRRHCSQMNIPWTRSKAQRSAHEMFQRMWDMKFLPPGRGLWGMGTPFMWERGGACLLNCGYYSTANIDKSPADPFAFMMDMSMLGVGVGFDTRGAGKMRLNKPYDKTTVVSIDDSREGWVDSVRVLIESYTTHPELGRIKFDYSLVRKAGSIIKGFGGKASGPGTLRELHEMMRVHLDRVVARIDPVLSSVDLVDIMNYLGRCVVAGNVRRSAQIVFGSADDMEYMQMKDKDLHKAELDSHRWASNNSLFAEVGMDYSRVAAQIAVNGEPGLVWLDNMQNYGRMIDGRQPGIDGRVMGCNPCSEQSLESGECCNLVETFPSHHDDVTDYHRTLKFAYLYAKTVTLQPTHNEETNAIALRNRRIGLSQSGIAEAFNKFGRRQVLTQFCDEGYKSICQWDKVYSDWLCIGRSIKKTSVKPSGTVSLLAGVTPGIHFSVAPTRAYWRSVRVSKDSLLERLLRQAGYRVEQDIRDKHTSVVWFGVANSAVPTTNEVSVWEQVKNACDYQRYWADNQVSCTVHFNEADRSEIAKVLTAFDDQLKGISFLPQDHGYEQAPYESASADDVSVYNTSLKPIRWDKYIKEDADANATKFCDGESCEIRK